MTITSFADLGVPRDLVRRLNADGIHEPFAIQALALRDALAGRDICGKAPTGSGKTLAFGIPLAALAAKAAPHRPKALVLVPTRELAAQVCDAVRPLAELRQRTVATFYGGTNIRRDQQRLRKGVDIAVCTPGRLADLVQRRDCDLRDVVLVVIDEADRMADMGFLPEVKRLLDRTSDQRQTLLFSATLDGDVDVLVKRYQNDPVRHEVESEGDDAETRHVFWPAERTDRRAITADIVQHVGPAIVFTRTKHGADRLAKQLSKQGIRTAAIHGNRSQNQRERALSQFADGSVTTLVATDVAARGIHVDKVGVVVHYDVPATDKDYVHRSGRTGRAGQTGLVVSLIAEAERRETEKLQRTLDLPQGLHTIDLRILTADELPTPSAGRATHEATPRHTGSSNGNRNGSSNRNRNANRNGNGGNRNNGNGGNRNANRNGQTRGGARPAARRRAG